MGTSTMHQPIDRRDGDEPPEKNGRQVATIPAEPGACRADTFDAANVEGIDEDRHTLGCPCGCEGDATVISHPGNDGEWIAATKTADALGIGRA